jgi:predicted glutamine amidotransferase
MCRLFALLGTPGSSAEPWLVSTDSSLLKQANHSPEEAQRDGWGIAWYDSGRRLHVEKGAAGAFEEGERPRFLTAARQAHGPVVFGHLRHASNPMQLAPERLIGLENSQPFVNGSRIAIHNGSIPFPREMRVLLGKYEPQVRGVNDSEILFYLLLRNLDEVGDPLGAYVRTRDELIKTWQEKGRPKGGPYSGLNIFFSRGPNELWAFCDWTGEHGGSFCSPNRPYYEPVYLADARQVILASEPLDRQRDDWRTLPRGHYLHGQASAGLVAVDTGPVPKAPLAPVA